MNLENVRIVLVGTTHPGNIGSAARAMKTMGLRHLHLVAPSRYPHPEATANAAHAEDVLQASQVHDGLDSALMGTGLVVGLTARPRRLSDRVLDARHLAWRIAAESERHPVAILFGREHSGLSNEELDRCQFIAHIPANPEYSVLNLAAAVQVMAYELWMATRGSSDCGTGTLGEPARQEHLEAFFHRLERDLDEVGFLRLQSPELLMRRLRRLFKRGRPDRTELDLLHGILRALRRGGGVGD
jgi:TrmH family RNA methyltransferase